MKKIGIFYGSTTGNTERIAQMLQEKIGTDNADLHNVADCSADDFSDYGTLILGTSTWGFGELQDDWESFLPAIEEKHVSGKKVAFFGLGDAQMYPDTFADAIGLIHEKLATMDVNFVGETSTNEYTFDGSRAVSEGKFFGLPLDEDNEDDATEERLENWVNSFFV